MKMKFKIGDEVLIHGYVDEIRNDAIIIKNQGGYFGTVASEIKKIFDGKCTRCKWLYKDVDFCSSCSVGKINLYEQIKKKEENKARTGEWVEVEISEHRGLSIVSMRCDQCGRYAYIVLPKGTKCVYDFCPWCKADMRGGKE